jgi:hypothetical protein
MVGLAVFAAASCLAWGLTASARASSEPVIESEYVSNITPTDATLNATISPNGLHTVYEFQIDTDASYNYTQMVCPLPVPGYAQCMAIGVGEPLPAGLVEPSPEEMPAGLQGGQTVSLDLASIGATLQPGVTYHFRVIAANTSDGQVVYGPDQTFTTSDGLLVDTAPSVDGESVSTLSSTDATLEAQINLHEAPSGAYYQFQVLTDPSGYASEIRCPSKLAPTVDGCSGIQSAGALPIGFIPGDTLQPGVDRPAALDLASAGVTLKPGTTYHYRVLVARRVQTEDTIQWEAPTVYGADRTFTTLPADAASGQTFPAPVAVRDPPRPGAGGGQPVVSNNSGQPTGFATTSTPTLQTSGLPGASSKRGAAKPAAKHKHHRTKAVRHRAKTNKHKQH